MGLDGKFGAMVMNPDDRADATLAELTAGRYELGFRSYLDSFHQITSHQRAKTSYLEGIWPHLAADFAETSYPYEIVCVKVGKALQFPSIFWAQVGI